MTLIVVESPTKARTFNRILKTKPWGKEYFVFATVGHFRDLPSKSISINIEKNFQPEYEIMEKKEKMVAKLKEIAEKEKTIILATDPDREGEAISYHVAQILGYLKEDWPDFRMKGARLKRIVFHEITPKALEEALNNPTELRMDLVKAQQARRILDRLVGYLISPLLWKKTGRRWLSAGRVQSVALRLISEREKEIKSFNIEKYFLIEGHFGDEGEIKAELASKGGVEYKKTISIELFDGKYEYSKTSIDENSAKEIDEDIRADRYKVSLERQEAISKFPPPPLTTSSLQQDAFYKLSFPSRLTMRIAQSLYEKGLITYHRTDSFNLSTKFVFSAMDHIKKVYGPEYALDKPRGYKTRSRNAQEAHEAIRPTQVEKTLKEIKTSKLTLPERKLYEMIYNRALATQMKEAKIFQSDILITGAKGYEFRAAHSQVLFDGFMKVLQPEFARSNTTKLQLKNGDTIILKSAEIIEKTTRPPYRYNEASLIKALEEKGIGRPSTYASIIGLILDKHYIEKEGRNLKPSFLGEAISGYLSTSFPDVFGLEFTANMEDSLDKIASGEKKLIDVLNDYYAPLSREISVQGSNDAMLHITEDVLEEKCPQCSHDLVARFGKYGKFYACSAFPKCRYIKPNLHFIKNHFCPLCAGRLVSRFSKKGKRFYGCENYPKCTHIQWALNVPIKTAVDVK